MTGYSVPSTGPLLPSEVRRPVTTTVGAFEVSAERLISWLAPSLATPQMRWSVERCLWKGLDGFVDELYPLEHIGISRVGILGVGEWSFMLNNSPLGTDLGVIPSLCARELGRRALRLTCQQSEYPATILEIYSPLADDTLRCRRSISAANDGGRWRFDEYGDRFPFEVTDAYKSKRVRDRFTPELLHRYVSAMNVPIAGSNASVTEAYLLRGHRAA